jgi:hypothetical protein
MLQVSVGQCQTRLSIGQSQFQFSFFVSFLGLLLRYRVSSYRYVNLSVSKFRSLERGGVSELSQAKVDR